MRPHRRRPQVGAVWDLPNALYEYLRLLDADLEALDGRLSDEAVKNERC